MSNTLETTIHDCYVDIYNRELNNDEINCILEKLPKDIISLADTWGGSDTEVREKMYEWLMTNCLVATDLNYKSSSVSSEMTEQELTELVSKSILDENKVVRSLMKPYLKKLIVEYYNNTNSIDLEELELSFIVHNVPNKIITLVREQGENEARIKNEIANWLLTSNQRELYMKYKNKKMDLF